MTEEIKGLEDFSNWSILDYQSRIKDQRLTIFELMAEIEKIKKSKTSYQIVQDENKDSLEIGTPGKNGALKIYGNFDKPEEFKIRIANAKKVREFAQVDLRIEDLK